MNLSRSYAFRSAVIGIAVWLLARADVAVAQTKAWQPIITSLPSEQDVPPPASAKKAKREATVRRTKAARSPAPKPEPIIESVNDDDVQIETPAPIIAQPASPPVPVSAVAPTPVAAKAAPPAATFPPKAQPSVDAPAAQHYCFNIADAAADARFAWQKKTISEIEAELDKRVAVLEAKTAEYREWVAKREEFSRKAQDGLVRIYARMKADAAAPQLAAMDEEAAAAVLMRLEAKVASEILSEMDLARAAKLTSLISGLGAPPEASKPGPPPVPATPPAGAP